MLDQIYMRVLDMTMAGSIVILAVLAARLVLKRAPKVLSYALWAVVLFRLLCPVTPESRVSAMPDIEPVAQTYTLSDESISFAGATVAAYRAVGDALNGGLGVQHIPTTQVNDRGGAAYVTSSWWEVWVLFGQYVWAAGVSALAAYSLVSWLRLKRKLVGAVPIEENIFLADHIGSPFVMGLVRPRIYLPSNLGEGERVYILAHERHHIRRFDHVFKALAFAALCVHWFNPLVWLAFRLAGQDMEMSCDEAVVKKLGSGIRADYSASLLSFATGSRGIGLTPLAFGEGNTRGRIKNLALWRKPKAWVTALGAAVCAVVLVACAADPAAREPEPESRLACDSYVSDRCLYMNPLSSYYPFGGDSGERYIVEENSFTIEGRNGVVTVIDPVQWGWREFPWTDEQWAGLFFPSGVGTPTVDRTQELRFQPLSERSCLLKFDEEVLLVQIQDINKVGLAVWSIYRLTPEEEMGSAQWEMEPLSSTWSPAFPILVDIPDTELSVITVDGQMAEYDITPQELMGEEGTLLFWSPVDKEGNPVYDAVLHLNALDGEQVVCATTIYITGQPSGDLGQVLYTASIVGEGVRMEQGKLGAVIRLK